MKGIPARIYFKISFLRNIIPLDIAPIKDIINVKGCKFKDTTHITDTKYTVATIG